MVSWDCVFVAVVIVVVNVDVVLRRVLEFGFLELLFPEMFPIPSVAFETERARCYNKKNPNDPSITQEKIIRTHILPA